MPDNSNRQHQQIGIGKVEYPLSGIREPAVVVPCRRSSSGSRHRYLMQLAMRIEPDEGRLMAWWTGAGIAELEGLTASELSSMGREQDVDDFLRAILNGERD